MESCDDESTFITWVAECVTSFVFPESPICLNSYYQRQANQNKIKWCQTGLIKEEGLHVIKILIKSNT